MDNEILNKLRKIKESYLEEDGLRSVLLEDISFIDEVINELELFYNMKPVGYLSPTASVCLKRGSNTIITHKNIVNYIPLYRLDK